MSISISILRQLLKEIAARFTIINRLDACMHAWRIYLLHPFKSGWRIFKKKKKMAAEDQEHMVIELRFRNYHADSTRYI